MQKVLFDEKEFTQKYNELKSSRKMAEYFKCSKNTILNYAKRINYNNQNNKEIKLPQEKMQEIIALYENQGISAITKTYNCSTTAVYNFFKKNNYIAINKNNKLNDITEKEFINSYMELKSAEKMGKRYHCSSTAILNYAKKIRYNPALAKSYKLSKTDKEFIIHNYHNYTSTELAKKFNVSRGMITKLWYDNNLLGKINNNITTTEKDITGQKFGKWTVLYKTNKRNAGGVIYWHCKCDCGIEKDVLGSSLRNGLSLSCGTHSNISKGNEKIKQILIENNIPFKIEYKFDSCKDKKILPFDFYINNQYLIEYDGIQHYDKNSRFDYEYTHKHDLIKSAWCKDNNIPLIRIPFWHYEHLKLQDLLLETSTFLENADYKPRN